MFGNKTIGSYRIIGCIGSGGMGNLYIGEDIHLKRKVAIKALKQDLLNQPHIIERFKLEAVTLARLNHPNVATIYAILQENNNYYIVIELISGWQLSTFIEKIGPLPLSVAFYFFKQVLAGVGSAHAENIVHRDLKPSNIMINENLIAKVTDFGIARFQGGNRLTMYDKLVGTIEYMSPEQILGKDVTKVSDIYSLGVLLFEMVTGRLPFSGDSDYELMKCQIENPPPSPLEFQANIPKRLVNILLRALAKNPQERFQSAEAFSNALDEIGINTSNSESQIHEVILSHQLADKKTMDYISPLGLDGKYQDQINAGNSFEIKKQISYYSSRFFGRLILFFTQRPWLGPLILFFSVSVVGGLILMNNSRFGHGNRIYEHRSDKEIGRIAPSEITDQEDLNSYDSRKMPVPAEINGGTVELYNNMSPAGGVETENSGEGVTDDHVWKAPEIKPLPLDPVQSPSGITPVPPLPKAKAPSRKQIITTKEKIGAEKKSGIEEKPKEEKLPVDQQTEVPSNSTTNHKIKYNEWIIHK